MEKATEQKQYGYCVVHPGCETEDASGKGCWQHLRDLRKKQPRFTAGPGRCSCEEPDLDIQDHKNCEKEKQAWVWNIDLEGKRWVQCSSCAKLETDIEDRMHFLDCCVWYKPCEAAERPVGCSCKEQGKNRADQKHCSKCWTWCQISNKWEGLTAKGLCRNCEDKRVGRPHSSIYVPGPSEGKH